MGIKNPTSQKGTVESFRNRSDLRELGIDRQGTTHFYDTDNHAILAVDTAGGLDRLPLDSDYTVAEYRQAVATRRGWAERVISAADFLGAA